MSEAYDDAVVGAGILGLAHAYHLARAGRRVIVFERHPFAQGASIRNFGMLWPIGQPAGELREMALRSRETWLTVAKEAGFWTRTCGSLHVAYHEDERQHTLFPEAFAAAALVRCKLQMMRTLPGHADIGPMLAAGLTLQHYRSFAACPTLPVLEARLAAELPFYGRFGIHVMVSPYQDGAPA